jgi:hypothetical protein
MLAGAIYTSEPMMRNKRTAPAAGCRPALLLMTLSVAASGIAAADTAVEDPSIEALQQQVRDLQTRVERLEATLREGVPVNPARTVQPLPGGWRQAANWQLLSKGLEPHEVIEILGEPQRRRSGNKFEYWEYGDGLARLYLRRLKSWEVPTGIAAVPEPAD